MSAPPVAISALPPPSAERPTAPRAAPGFDAALQRAADRPSGRPPVTQVPLRHTVLSPDQARTALSEAWTEMHGSPPDEPTLGILVAQWAHETGGGASMYNYNFGGIKGAGPTGMTASARTREGHGDNERVIHDRFRAYSTAREGARDYLGLLARRYPDALSQASTGDAASFVDALHRGGYFTGSKEAYTRSIAQLSHSTLPDRSREVAPERPVPRTAFSPVAHSSRALPVDVRQLQPFLDRGGAGTLDEGSLSLMTAGLVDALSQSSFRIMAASDPNELEEE